MQQYSFTSSKAFMETFDIAPYQSGILSGLTFAAKDVFDIADHVTSWGNPTWAKLQPKAVVNAIVVDQLLTAGARFIGKTITSEFTFDLLGNNYFYGIPVNPKAPDRLPGGSSNGSASAVACELVDFALGTDTGGSIRVPASYCGVWGYRPSHDRISVSGIPVFAPSFDTAGILANNADVLIKAATVLLGKTAISKNSSDVKVYLLEDMLALCDEEVCNASTKVINQFIFEKINLPKITHQKINYEWLFETFNFLQWSEINNSLGAWVAHNKPELGPVTAKNLELTQTVDRSKIQSAIIKREWFATVLNEFLNNHNILCMPTTPTLAPKPGSIPADRRIGTFFPRTIAFTAIAGLARLPQISIPLAEVNGVPVGISFIAAQGNDELLLDFCRRF